MSVTITNNDGKEMSFSELVAALRDMANNPNASPEDRDLARDLLEHYAKEGSDEKAAIARAALAKLEESDKLKARMGLPTRRATRVHNVGNKQVFPAMTPAEARAFLASKSR